MRINLFDSRHITPIRAAFTLPEVLMGVLVMSVVIVSLGLGFSQGFAVVQISRENLRATQILQEKTEAIRLFTWDQITTDGFVPHTFYDYFYDKGSTTNRGVVFNGTASIVADPSVQSYAVDQRLITFTLTWTSGSVQRTRTMRTIVSRFGLQNYVYASP